MNLKVVCIGIVLGIVIVYFLVGDNFTNNKINIESQDDLKKILVAITNEMMDSKINLDHSDIIHLLGPNRDVDIIIVFPNDMQSNHTGPYGDSLDYDTVYQKFTNGTRIFQATNDNGDILRQIMINDQPEKVFIMIMMDDD